MSLLKELSAYAALGDIPDYVKEASVEDRPTRPVDFADADRRYPVNSKAATWLSNMRYQTAVASGRPGNSRVEQTLQKWATHWGILADCLQAGSLIKQAADVKPDESDYALVTEYDGSKVMMFPVRNAEEIKQAAADLYRNRSTLQYEWRRAAAEKILKEAAALNVQVDRRDYLEQAAGVNPAPREKLAEALHRRALLYLDTEAISRADEASRYITDEPGMAKTACVVMDRLDRITGVYKKYGNGIATPEELCFSKRAQPEPERIEVAPRIFIEKEAIAKLPADRMHVISRSAAVKVATFDGLIDPDRLERMLPELTTVQRTVLSKVLR